MRLLLPGAASGGSAEASPVAALEAVAALLSALGGVEADSAADALVASGTLAAAIVRHDSQLANSAQPLKASTLIPGPRGRLFALSPTLRRRFLALVGQVILLLTL